MVRARDSRRWVGSSWSGRGRSSGRSSDQRGRCRAVLKGAGKGAGSALSRRELAAPSSTAVRLMTSALLVDRAVLCLRGDVSRAGKTTLAHMVIASRAAVTWSPTHTGALIGQRCPTVELVRAGRLDPGDEVVGTARSSPATCGQWP